MDIHKKTNRRRLLLLATTALVLGAVYATRTVNRLANGQDDTAAFHEEIPQASAPGTVSLDDQSGEWPCWRGPSRDGKSPETGITTDWTNGLPLLWQIGFLAQGANAYSHAAPVVSGGRLIVMGRDPDHDIAFCLSTQDGSLLWSHLLANQAKGNFGRGARATPCIHDGKVYTFGRSGTLACLDLETGDLVWRLEVSTYHGEAPSWGHASSPLVANGLVYIQGGGDCRALAVDAQTGKLVWKSGTGTAGYAAPSLLTSPDGPGSVLMFHAGGLTAHHPTDGSEQWFAPWTTSYDVNATTPIITKHGIVISSGYGTGGQLIKPDGSAAPVWTSKTYTAHHTDPIVIGDTLYGYSGRSDRNKGDLVCIDLPTGQEHWRTKDVGFGTLTYIDGYLICLDIKGNLFLVRPTAKTFNLTSSFPGAIPKAKQPCWTVPVIANGRLFLRYRQQLLCYQLIPPLKPADTTP